MKASQIAWLVSLAAFVSTALIGEAQLLGDRWHHAITVVSVIATAISGFMLQHPWDGRTDRREGQSPTYFVVHQGVASQVTQQGFETVLRGAAEQLPQPLPPRESRPFPAT